MEKSSSQNIQDAFLNTMRREKATVTIQLIHGATLIGRLKSFDKFSVMLDSGGQEFLIFKHAIATVTHPRRSPNDIENQGGGQTPDVSSAPPPQFRR